MITGSAQSLGLLPPAPIASSSSPNIPFVFQDEAPLSLGEPVVEGPDIEGLSWAPLHRHNVKGVATFPVQLLAYHVFAKDKSVLKRVRESAGSVLAGFAPTHLNDLQKTTKPASRAKEIYRLWSAVLDKTIEELYDDEGASLPEDYLGRARERYDAAALRAEDIDFDVFESNERAPLPRVSGRFNITTDQVLAAACMVLSGVSEHIPPGRAARILERIFRDNQLSSFNFLAVADAGPESTVSRANAGLVTAAIGCRRKYTKVSDAWDIFRLERGA